MRRSFLAIMLVCCGCSKEKAPTDRGRMADLQVPLKNQQGVTVGQVFLTDVAEGVRLVGWANNLPVGDHSVRLFAGTRCDEGFARGAASKPRNTDETYFGDLGGSLATRGEAGEISTTIERIRLGDLRNAAGATVLVGPAGKNADREKMACGIVPPSS